MPRVWLALFFGYSGKNFNGLQHQKEESVRTVEGEIVRTLFKGGLLETDDYYDLVKNYKWGRAARTDKGVHAVSNSISSLFFINEKFYDEERKLKRNELWGYLRQIFESTQISFHCFKKVTPKFDLRQMVKERTYCYLCSLSLFSESEGGKNQTEEAIVDKINDCCKLMVGSQNFHNYSKGYKAKDPRSRRYVTSFKCERVKEYVRFTIKGQSFIYHQIRKMIGCIVEVFMHNYTPTYISNTFYNNQHHVLLAPPYGLYLNKLGFDSYNRKNDIPQKIQFSEQIQLFDLLQQKIEVSILGLGQEIWKKWHQQIKQGRSNKFDDEQNGEDDD